MKIEPVLISGDEHGNVLLLPVPLMSGPNLFAVSPQMRVPDAIEVPDDQVSPYYFAQRQPRGDATSVLLILNDKCNYACSYCFELESSRSDASLNELDAIAAVERAFSNAARLGKDDVNISFFGGEPTLSLDTLKLVVAHANASSKNTGIQPKFGLTTNGSFGPKVLDYIIATFDNVILSLDGPEGIHDKNRRTVGGKATHGHVFANAQRLFSHFGAACLTFRATIDSDEVTSELAAVVDFYEANFPGAYVHIEPALNLGDGDEIVGKYDAFAKAYIETLEKIVTIRVQHSDLFFKFKADLTELDFCGSSSSNFYVTPSGAITSCSRSIREHDSNSGVFFAGRIQDGSFVSNPVAENLLKRNTVGMAVHCRTCFARFNCKSGCPSLNLALAHTQGARGEICKSVKWLTQQYLLHLLRHGEKRQRIGDIH